MSLSPAQRLHAAQLRFVGASRRLDVARAQHREQPSAARAHTVVIYQAGVELALRYLERAEQALVAV